ncbi:MAG: SEC-C domain-containing protein [Propionibacteriales bacterium]|nr:SEC-C domain-containing protein [Propionibacteriales bacterium]
MSDPPTGPLFHGGAPGLKLGDLVRSAYELGVVSVSGASGAPYRSDRVYLTTSLDCAEHYAGVFLPQTVWDDIHHKRQPDPMAHRWGASIYEVDTDGPLVLDADHDDGFSWEAPVARVIRLVQAVVSPNLAAIGFPDAKVPLVTRSTDGAPGANQPCFCGSQRKYKRCHGG